GDSGADFVFANPENKVQIYSSPRGAPSGEPSITIPVTSAMLGLDVADLNADGVPDIAGWNRAGVASVVLLGPNGTLLREIAITGLPTPQGLTAGHLVDGIAVDLVLPCSATNQLSVIPGAGDGTFGVAREVPTVEFPWQAVIADVDGDGRNDVAVRGESAIALHRGMGGGDLAAPETVLETIAVDAMF